MREDTEKTMAEELQGAPEAVIMAMLWCNRHRLQDMTMTLPKDQIKRLKRALEYNEQDPRLHVTEGRYAISVCMLDAAGNQIIQSESAEEDQAAKERAAKVTAAAGSAEQLVADHRAMAARGEVSDSLTGEMYEALTLLAKAVRQ